MKISKFLEKIALLLAFCCTSILIVGTGMVWRGERFTTTYHATHVLYQPDKKVLKALFSPRDNPKQVLLGLIDMEKKGISIASFRLTDPDIAQSLEKAHRRGVKLKIVSDTACPESKHSKIPFLSNSRIDIRLFPVQGDKGGGRVPLMHNKYMLFEKSLHEAPLVWTGSFNFTWGASNINQENVLITNDPEVYKAYCEHFAQLYAMATPLKPTSTQHYRPAVQESSLSYLLALWKWLHIF